MNNKFGRFFSENFLLVFFALMIIPFLILSFYNHPSSDDWLINYVTDAKSFVESQIYFYTNWFGRYFSIALLSLSPLHFDSFTGYKVIPFLLILLFIYVLFLLISELTRRSLGFKERSLLTLSLFFIYIYAMPTVSQGFYWLAGAIPYQLGIILIMLFLFFYIKSRGKENSDSTKLPFFLTVITLIALAGSSEMSMFMGALIIGMIIIYKLITEKKLDNRIIFLTAVIVICSLIMILAPGNAVRGTQYTQAHRLIPAIMITFKYLFGNLGSWIFMTPLIFITLLVLPVLLKITGNTVKIPENIFTNPFYTIPLFFVILSFLFFVPAWNIGGEPFSRTVNFIYFIFLAGWFYNVLVVLNFLRKKYDFNIDRIPRYVYTVAFVIVLLFLFKKNNVKNAYSDLFKGRAAKYDNEQYARYDFINKSSADTLLIPAIVNKPSTIFICDITPEMSDQLNITFAHYFGKKTMYIIEIDSLKNKN